MHPPYSARLSSRDVTRLRAARAGERPTTSAARRGTVALFVAALVGAGLGQLPPERPAQASVGTPGDAAARGIIANLNAGTLGLNLTGLNATLGSADAPANGAAGTNSASTGSLGAGTSGSIAQVSASVNGITATRSRVKTSSHSEITNVSLGAFGAGVLTTGVISADATCPSSGAQGANTTVTGVQLFGTSITALPVNQTVTRSGSVSVSGLLHAQLQVGLVRTEQTSSSSAAATALTVSLTLTADLGINVNLGSVVLASATCSKPAVPDVVTNSITPGSGRQSGGVSATVTGSGFVPGATTVTVGGAPATVTNVSSDGTSVTFTTPTTPVGPQRVVVSSSGGSGAALSYTALADGSTSTANSPTPSSGFTSGGGTITITGSNLGAATGVTVGGTQAANFTVNPAGTTITATVPTTETAGNVPVVVQFPAGTLGAGSYTYRAPTITSISPAQGATAGSTAVTITGTGLSGATRVTFGGNPATGMTVNSAGTVITATTPSGPAGLADVVVELPGADATLTGGYSYQPPGAPAIGSVSPAAGPTAGGTDLKLTGSNLGNVSSGTVNGQNATVVSVSSGEVHLTAPASEATGPVDITLTSPAGTGTLPKSFSYTGPTITSVTPSSGPQSGGTQVTVTGTGLASTSAVTVGGNSASGVQAAANGTSVSFSVPSGTPGDASVVLNVTGADPAPARFGYLVDGSQATFSSISPSSIPTAGRSVTITGTNLTGATGATFGGSAGSNPVVSSDGTTITVTAPATENAGSVPVVVQFPAGAPSAGSIGYVAPTITSVSPANGPDAGNTSVTLTGTNLTGATGVSFGGTPATAVTVVSDTRITATTPGHGTGTVDVTAVLPGADATAAGAFQYRDDGSQATVSSISPSTIPSSGGGVTITGSNLGAATGATVDGVPAGNFTVGSNGTTVTFSAPETNSPGSVRVVLQFPAGTAQAGNITYAAPTISQLSPAQGPLAGGTSVTISGSGLAAATSVTFGGTAGTNLVANQDGSLTVTTPQGANAGRVDVVVALPGADAASPGGYAYVSPSAPTITSLDTTSGPSTGGTTVTITGSGLDTVTSVTFEGVPATIRGTPTATSLTVVTPAANTPGPADVELFSPNGTSVLPNGFLYVGATLTAISPPQGPVAAGNTVTLTGTFLALASRVTVGGVDVGSLQAAPDGTTISFTMPSEAAGPAQVAVQVPGPDPSPLTYTFVADGSNATVTNVAPPVPTSGGQVTLTGTNLTGASGITFAGVAGTNVAVTPDGTTLTAIAPTSETAGPAPLALQFPAGTLTNAGIANYVAPTIGGISPDRGSVTGSTNVTITGNGLNAATAVTFDGAPATNFAVDPNGRITATTPQHASGAVDVVVVLPGADATSVGGYSYVPLAPPTITSISPATSTTAGGEVLTLTGSDLTNVTRVTIGGRAAAIQGTPSDNQLRVLVPPSETDGPVDVAAVASTGAGLSPTQLRYLAPTITSIDPSTGPVSAGGQVTVLGTGLSGADSVTFDGIGAPIQASDPAGSAITVTVPGHAAGAVNVAVSLPGMDALRRSAYTYIPDGSDATISSLSPASIPAAGGTVTLVGTNFTGATAVTFDGVAATNITVDPSGTRITATAPPSENAGPVPVLVWFPAGDTAAGNVSYVAPALYGVYPGQGSDTGGTSLTLSGIGLVGATNVYVDGVAATHVVVDPSGNSLTATTPAATHGDGTFDVRVELPGMDAVLTSSFAYQAANADTIVSLSPAYGPTTGGTTVTLNGSFSGTATAVNFGGHAAVIASQSATQITVQTPSVSAAGPADVQVVDGSTGTTLPRGFDYADPTISSMSPMSGPAGGGTTVTIDGGALGDVTGVTVGGAAAQFTINARSSRITFTTPPGTPGNASVVFVTANGPISALTQQFQYIADGSNATVATVNPGSVPASGGNVTLTGTGLRDAVQVTFDGVPGAIVSQSPDGTSMLVSAPSSGDNSALIQVVYPAGTISGGTLSYVPPTIAGIAPQTGSESGGTQVTLSGTGLGATTAVRVHGQPVTYSVNSDGTRITFVTPSGPVGDANVTVDVPGQSPAPARFTYLANGSSTTTSPIATVSAPTSGGASISLFGTGLQRVSRVLVGRTAATNMTVNSAGTALTAVVPASETSGSADITLEFPAGSTAVGTVNYTGPGITGITPTTGPTSGMTAVTITGTGFTGTTGVTFDGVSGLTPTVNSNGTQITVSTPSHAVGAVDVVVQLPGADAASPGAFTYYQATPTASSTAIVTAITPPSTPTYGGGTVTITGSGLAGVTGVTFNGTAGTGVTAGATTVTVQTPPGDEGTKTVAMIFSDNSTKTAGTIVLTPPTITSVQPAYANIGGGSLVRIQGTGLGGATGVTFDGVAGVLVSARWLATSSSASVEPGSSGGPRAAATRVRLKAAADGPVLRAATAPDSEVVAKAPAKGSPGVSAIDVAVPGQDPPTRSVIYASGPTASGMIPTSGPSAGGQTVTITGTGFGSTTTVTFGDVAATTVVASSSTQLTAVTPAHAAGPVYVVVSTGNVPASPLNYTYLADADTGGGTTPTPTPTPSPTPTPTRPPAGTENPVPEPPVHTGVSPARGSAAGGEKITVHGRHFVPGQTSIAVCGQRIPASDVTVPDDGTSATFVAPACKAGRQVIHVLTANGATDVDFTYGAAGAVEPSASPRGPSKSRPASFSGRTGTTSIRTSGGSSWLPTTGADETGLGLDGLGLVGLALLVLGAGCVWGARGLAFAAQRPRRALKHLEPARPRMEARIMRSTSLKILFAVPFTALLTLALTERPASAIMPAAPLAFPAKPAGVGPGDATASALQVEFEAASVPRESGSTSDGQDTVEHTRVDFAAMSRSGVTVQAPRSDGDRTTGDVPISARTGSLVARGLVRSLSAERRPDRSTAGTAVARFHLVASGSTLLSAEGIDADVRCPAEGSGQAPSATVTTSGLQVLGSPAELGPEPIEVDTPLSAPDDAVQLHVVLEKSETADDHHADATVEATLAATDAGGAPIELGTVRLATASCVAASAPAAGSVRVAGSVPVAGTGGPPPAIVAPARSAGETQATRTPTSGPPASAPAGAVRVATAPASTVLPQTGPPGSAVPVSAAPARNASHRAAPADTAPARSAAVRPAPVRSGPIRMGPVRTSPVRSAPAGSGVSARPASVRTGPVATPAVGAASAGTVLVRSAPTGMAPTGSAPAGTGPVRSAPVSSAVPARPAPVGTAPIRSAPHHVRPARIAAARTVPVPAAVPEPQAHSASGGGAPSTGRPGARPARAAHAPVLGPPPSLARSVQASLPLGLMPEAVSTEQRPTSAQRRAAAQLPASGDTPAVAQHPAVHQSAEGAQRPASGQLPEQARTSAGQPYPASVEAPAEVRQPASGQLPGEISDEVPAASLPAGDQSAVGTQGVDSGWLPTEGRAPAGVQPPQAGQSAPGGQRPASGELPGQEEAPNSAAGQVPLAGSVPSIGQGTASGPAPASVAGESAPDASAVEAAAVGKAPAAKPVTGQAFAPDPLLIAALTAPVSSFPEFTPDAAPMALAHAPAAGLRPELSSGQAVQPAAAAGPVIGSVSPTRGVTDGGTRVTITGSHLNGGTVVVCGAKVPASAVSTASDGHTLSFVTPACNAGTSPVHLITSTGIAEAQFTYGGTTAESATNASNTLTGREAGNPGSFGTRTLAATSPQNLAAGLLGAMLLAAGVAACRVAVARPASRRFRRGLLALPHPAPAVIGQGWHPDLDTALHRRGF